MKKLLLLMMATILCLNTMAQQDAEGYWDITQKQDNGSTLRFLQSPENRIKKKAIVDKYDTDIFVSYYNILTKETSRKGTKIQYKYF